VINKFKQEQKEYVQVNDIYFNSKRFELVTLQSLAKHYDLNKDFQKAFVVAFLAYNKNSEFMNTDPIYSKVNEFMMAKQSQDAKQKQNMRNNEMRDIIKQINKDQSHLLNQFENKPISTF
jgi:hypothetical protein